jgi:hypothetical protein
VVHDGYCDSDSVTFVRRGKIFGELGGFQLYKVFIAQQI